MWTRGRLRRVHIPAPHPHVHADTRKGRIIRTGAPMLRLPRPVVAMDPSDKGTWTRPVRFT